MEGLTCTLKEMLIEIGFIKDMRTTRGNKEVLQTFFLQFLFAKIRFNPFDSVPLTAYH